MTDVAATASGPVPLLSVGIVARYRGWIHSPFFDLAFFTLSPLIGVAIGLFVILRPELGALMAVAATFLLGVPHYLSTFTFFMGDENRAYYLTRPLIFLGAPIAIIAAVIGLRFVHFDTPVIIAMFVWNIWHVSLQSAGILGIYRRLNRGADSERQPARLALVTTAAAMAFWRPTTFPPITKLIESIHAGLYRTFALTLVTVAAISVAFLAYNILKRKRSIAFAEIAFLLTSFALFQPYLWMRDGNQATLAMLCGHYVQYLAIVWLFHARKYAGDNRGSLAQLMLRRVSGSGLAVLGYMVATAVLVWLFSRLAAAAGVPMAFVVSFNALALVHFYLDGHIWAFKQPFVRKTIGPILAPEQRRVIE